MTTGGRLAAVLLSAALLAGGTKAPVQAAEAPEGGLKAHRTIVPKGKEAVIWSQKRIRTFTLNGNGFRKVSVKKNRLVLKAKKSGFRPCSVLVKYEDGGVERITLYTC